jgi:hypothetical protein
MEPEPLASEPSPPGPTVGRRGVSGTGPLVGYLFVLAFGLLLTYGLVAGAVDRAVFGGRTVKMWGFYVLGPVALLFDWAGVLGLRYWHLQRTGRGLPPTSSKLVATVRRLFHGRWEG